MEKKEKGNVSFSVAVECQDDTSILGFLLPQTVDRGQARASELSQPSC